MIKFSLFKLTVVSKTSIGVGTIGRDASIGSTIAEVELLGSLQVLGGLSGESHGEHDEEGEDSKLWKTPDKSNNLDNIIFSMNVNKNK